MMMMIIIVVVVVKYHYAKVRVVYKSRQKCNGEYLTEQAPFEQ